LGDVDTSLYINLGVGGGGIFLLYSNYFLRITVATKCIYTIS